MSIAVRLLIYFNVEIEQDLRCVGEAHIENHWYTLKFLKTADLGNKATN